MQIALTFMLAAASLSAGCDTGIHAEPADLSAGVVDLLQPLPPGFMPLVPCADPASYVEPGNAIKFGGPLGTHFSPKCLSVPASEDAGSAVVTFSGDFSIHPLSKSTRGALDNPIPIISPTGIGVQAGTSTQTVTFTAPGFYPYFCQVHGEDDGKGMSGVVWVK